MLISKPLCSSSQKSTYKCSQQIPLCPLPYLLKALLLLLKHYYYNYLDFHPALMDVHRVRRILQGLVNFSPTLKKLLPVVPMVSFRRPKNLKDLLVRAKVRPLEEKIRGMFCCGKTRCLVCRFVKTGKKLVGNVEQWSFHIIHAFDCDSNGVVYLRTCKRYNKQYVGSTITSFRLRFNNHKSALR